MAVTILKCPNCGGELVFDPGQQKQKCEYCGSQFGQQELEKLLASQENSGEDGGDEQDGRDACKAKKASGRTDSKTEAMFYTCPNCGAQIVTEETTAATFCYYCHSPVVLQGRLSGEFSPDLVIPFAFDKKEAVKQFLNYVGRKKFVPKDFFDESQIEKLCGVYYPYWSCDCELTGKITGEAAKVRVWQNGETEFTETSMYRVKRSGAVSLEYITRNALTKGNRALVEGVLPYRLREAKKFHLGYLSGFLAEKRDMEREQMEEEVHQEARKQAERSLRNSIQGYSTVTVGSAHTVLEQEHWRYLLLPVWVLTYRGKEGDTYFYAMNGQTGTVWGELPVDYKKLGIFSGIVMAVVFLLALLLFLAGGYGL